jgi:superfamily II DNA helicase RecQ
MKIVFFTIPVQNPEASSELNAFLASHRIVRVDRQFVPDGANSAWSIAVTCTEGGTPAVPAERRGKIDYREVLSPEAFALFAKLRTLRKELSEKEGVPAYTLFTNEQLADMVRKRVSSARELEQISGVGQSRVKKYGEPFLAILKEHGRPDGAAAPAKNETSSNPPR